MLVFVQSSTVKQLQFVVRPGLELIVDKPARPTDAKQVNLKQGVSFQCPEDANYGDCAAVARISSTGKPDRTSRSAVLPSNNRLMPPRPCVVITIRSGASARR